MQDLKQFKEKNQFANNQAVKQQQLKAAWSTYIYL
jgi:hypothetical protein